MIIIVSAACVDRISSECCNAARTLCLNNTFRPFLEKYCACTCNFCDNLVPTTVMTTTRKFFSPSHISLHCYLFMKLSPKGFFIFFMLFNKTNSYPHLQLHRHSNTIFFFFLFIKSK